MSTLIKNPTVEGIACLIRDKHDMTKSVVALVPLQESEKRPFFCVHPFMGNVFCYIQLARLQEPLFILWFTESSYRKKKLTS